MMAENKLQTNGVIQKQVGHIRALHPKVSLRSSEMWYSEQMGQHKAEHTTIHAMSEYFNMVMLSAFIQTLNYCFF